MGDRLNFTRSKTLKLKSMKTKTTLPEKIARKFSALLLAELGARTLAQVNKRNFPHEKCETPKTCASHEFCDPNETMARAFRSLGLHAPGDRPAWTKAAANAKGELWGAAWTLAKVSRFYLPRMGRPARKVAGVELKLTVKPATRAAMIRKAGSPRKLGVLCDATFSKGGAA